MVNEPIEDNIGIGSDVYLSVETSNLINPMLEHTVTVTGDPVCPFRFEGPMKLNQYQGKRFYRIYNMISRHIAGQREVLKAGQAGGYVEHPEYVDPQSDFWISPSAIVCGKTLIKGSVSIRNAKVIDSILNGTISIGQDMQHQLSMVGRNGSLKNPMTVIRNSEISAGKGQITIGDCARVIRSRINGDSTISGHAKLHSCEIFDGYIQEFAWLTHDTISKSSIKGQCSISGSILNGVDLDGNINIENAFLNDIQFSGNRHIVGNRKTEMGRFGLPAQDLPARRFSKPLQ